MSKSGQLYLELEDQANRLGFESVEEAQASGCEIVGTQLVFNTTKALARAHEDWEKEKEEVLEELRELVSAYQGSLAVTAPAEHAIKFILNGER